MYHLIIKKDSQINMFEVYCISQETFTNNNKAYTQDQDAELNQMLITKKSVYDDMNIVVEDSTNLGLANWKSFPLLEKMMSPTSASHRTERSCAFFIKPPLRFENVTCLVVAFSILLILIFRRTISLSVFWNSSSFCFFLSVTF